MLKKTGLFVLVLASLLVMPAKAAFVYTDWKSDGDKKAVLHTNTGLEWLNLKETAGKSINEVKSLLSTTYLGWRLPTHDEMKTLAVAIFPTVEPRKDVFSNSPISFSGEQMVTHSMLGQIVTSHTYGIYEVNGGTYAFSSRQINDPSLWFNYEWAKNTDWKRIYEGVYLVSDGGVTLSSTQDPMLNINNPNAPVNNQPEPEVTPVSAPAGLAAFGALLMLIGTRKRMTT